MVFTKLECAFVMKKEEKKRQKEEEEKDIWIRANIFFCQKIKANICPLFCWSCFFLVFVLLTAMSLMTNSRVFIC